MFCCKMASLLNLKGNVCHFLCGSLTPRFNLMPKTSALNRYPQRIKQGWAALTHCAVSQSEFGFRSLLLHPHLQRGLENAS